MKVLTVVGARPQFVKAAPVSIALTAAGHQEVLIHTGQHYDDGMSAVFFRELDMQEPHVDLGIGSRPRGVQVRRMLGGVSAAIARDRPDRVLVYGDTNSTLAAALAASLADVALAHVEAGLRSFDRSMPEEANRIVTDHLSDLLFCPSDTSVANLEAEGIVEGVHVVGDVMLDALTMVSDGRGDGVLADLGLTPGEYVFATVHRASNTDDASKLMPIMTALGELGERVVLPKHPRTAAALERAGYVAAPGVSLIEPVGYVESVALVRSARVVATDSGGLQKEAFWLKTPCVTMRDQTEWTETVDAGWNVVVGADTVRITDAVKAARAPDSHPALYGEPGAAGRLVELI